MSRKQVTGLGVDASGGPTIDPTANVIALNDAANKRQDDLREVNNRYLESRISSLEQIAQIRAEHSKEIRQLESDRLDKIRQVDVLAGNTAADRALVAIQTLAATTTANAETLRAMVASTASTVATQFAAAMAAVTERLAALEKSSYEGKGRQAYSDPAMAEMLSEMKAARQQLAEGAGKSTGLSLAWALVIGIVGLIGTILGIGGVVWAMRSP